MIVVDVPLLFESNLDRFMGWVILVGCDRDIQIQRLQERNRELGEEDVLKRIHAQMPIDMKLNKADVVIWNNGSREALKKKVERLIQEMHARKPSWWRTQLYRWCWPWALCGMVWSWWQRYWQTSLAWKQHHPLVL